MLTHSFKKNGANTKQPHAPMDHPRRIGSVTTRLIQLSIDLCPSLPIIQVSQDQVSLPCAKECAQPHALLVPSTT
jgi:hypothetical protein